MRLRSAISLFIIILSACGTDSSPAPTPPAATTPSGLWTVAGVSGALVRLDPIQLVDTGKRIPASVLTTPSAGLATVSAVAFADDGTLWVASQDDSALLGFFPGTLGGSGVRTADVIISSNHGSLSAPAGLAFDRAGQLWVTNSGNGTIVRFDPAQLVSGAPTPAVTISGLSHPTGVAIDRVGGMWFTDRVANTVSRFTFGELARSGTPQPTVAIRSTGGSLSSPTGIAIDSSGALWVANAQTSTLASFGFDQIRDSGATVPRVLISSNVVGSMVFPEGLAFDSAGSLWVVSIGGELSKFTIDQLAATGNPVPSVHLRILGRVLFWGVALYPVPTGLPLN